jgi:hypothetical protein
MTDAIDVEGDGPSKIHVTVMVWLAAETRWHDN